MRLIESWIWKSLFGNCIQIITSSELGICNQIRFSFSYDHRLVDGVTASQFVETVIEGIEVPTD